MAAVIVIHQSDSIFERIFLVFSLLLVTSIVIAIVDNHQRQVLRISHAKNVVLQSFDGKISTYPADLKLAIKDMTSKLNENENRLKITLRCFRVGAWVPVLFGLIVLIESS
jgi:hypothetical protein